MRPPPPQAAGPKPERKAHHHAGKKFVAVTSSSRRRPVMARRQSSQSSTGSEVGSREGGGSGSSTTKYLASRQRNSPSIAEHPSDSQNSQSSTASFGQEDNPGAPSSKAAGKRPARIPPEIRSPYFENSNARSQAGGIATQRGPTTLDGRLSRRSESGSAISDTLRRPPVAGFVGQPDVDAGSRKMVRSESNREYTYSSRQQQAFAAAVPPPDFITSKVAGTTSVTAATSNVAVQGQFDFDVPTAATSTATEARDIPDQVMMASSRRSSTSLFAPTQPSPTPAAPLARSKSQLALLLELDKERQPNRHHKNGVGQAGKTARTDRET
ncbi:hypothetical protein VTK73DRAFT_1321 [Phialemonium thermophilum]|uniref:Proteophosphoglycan ppg4 n=1 Tax=Phialemonium thermophilum TaxID=223376 RepID=A0ABR3VTL2_9PEZI